MEIFIYVNCIQLRFIYEFISLVIVLQRQIFQSFSRSEESFLEKPAEYDNPTVDFTYAETSAFQLVAIHRFLWNVLLFTRFAFVEFLALRSDVTAQEVDELLITALFVSLINIVIEQPMQNQFPIPA